MLKMLSSNRRGQTLIDFSFGVTIFLIVVVFVFIFVPALFIPFDDDSSNSIAADRVADELVKDALLDKNSPESYKLDTDCTANFFAAVNSENDVSDAPYPKEGCRFSQPSNDLSVSDIIPVQSEIPEDVRTVEVEIVSYGSNNVQTVESSITGSKVNLSSSEDIIQRDIQSSVRNVNVGGEQYKLIVRVS